MNLWRVPNKFLAEIILSMDEIVRKIEIPTGQLAKNANAVPDATALVDRQKKNIVLHVENETTLSTDVG